MRLLIADDHQLFRESLRSLLEARGHQVVGEAGDGAGAVRLAREVVADVVLMDLEMPGTGGLEATRAILEATPGARIVILTGASEEEHLLDALRAGVQGFLRKDLEAETFLRLLEGVPEGRPALHPTTSRRLMRDFGGPGPGDVDDPDALTDRELEVLRSMASGVTSNRGLARHLGVSENTVKFHVRNILDKLQLHDRAQAIAHALRTGLVRVDEVV